MSNRTTHADKPELFEEGLRRLESHEPRAAISAFQTALEADPNSPGAYSGIGQAFLDMGEFQGAKVAFSKSIELGPTAARYVLLGYALEQLGEHRKAFRAYRSAVRMAPRDYDALYNMAKLLEKRHPTIAAAFFAKTIDLNDDFGPAYLELGALLNRSGRFEEAKKTLQKAIQIKPDDVWVWVELANSLWRTGEQQRAEETLNAASHKFPTESVPVWTLAAFLEKVGRTEDASRLFREAVNRQPTDKIAQEMLAGFQDRQR